MKRELLELATHVNQSLTDYVASRPIYEDNTRRWLYLMVLLTFGLAYPFCRSIFRDYKLTISKINKVKETRRKINDLVNVAITKPDSEVTRKIFGYLDMLNQTLLNLLNENYILSQEHNKRHYSRKQIHILGLKESPTLFQSGLTTAIESCLEFILEFREKHFQNPSSTAQVNTNLAAYPDFYPQYGYQPPVPIPAYNPQVVVQQQYQPLPYGYPNSPYSHFSSHPMPQQQQQSYSSPPPYQSGTSVIRRT